MRALIYERGPDLFDVELEDGKVFTWLNRTEVEAKVRELELVPWRERQRGAVDMDGGPQQHNADWFLGD